CVTHTHAHILIYFSLSAPLLHTHTLFLSLLSFPFCHVSLFLCLPLLPPALSLLLSPSPFLFPTASPPRELKSKQTATLCTQHRNLSPRLIPHPPPQLVFFFFVNFLKLS